MPIKPLWRPFSAVLFPLCFVSAMFFPPAGEQYARVSAAGSILPGGRLLQPLGIQIETGPGPFGIALSAKGTIATADIGSERFGITVIAPAKNSWSVHHLWTRTPKLTSPEQADPEWKGVFFGIAFEGEKSLWVSEGESGKVRLVDAQSGQRKKLVDLNDTKFRNSYSSDLAYDEEGHALWVLDQANFRLCGIDTRTGQVISSVAVGRMPFSIALSGDGKTAYVTNSGTFRYRVLPGADAKDMKRTGLPFPAFGFPSPESLDGTVRRSEAGDVVVPGLGDPNALESNSVSVVSLDDPNKPVVRGFVKTGTPYSADTAGGASPSGVLVAGEHVYVSNAHNDSITVLTRQGKLEREIPLRIPSLEKYRGILPAGMAYDPVTKWLLIAEAGINAVGVVNTVTGSLIAQIPVGWMPTRVRISGDRVFVTNARGRGTGPHMRRPLAELGEPSLVHAGTVSTFVMPAASELNGLTAKVFTSNGFVPHFEDPPAFPAQIRHVVLIVKENRTFDEVFGDVKEAGGRKVVSYEPLARLGMHGNASGHKEQFSMKDVPITPNHHAMAKQWAFSDNFYADSDVSVDGHHWIVGSYPDLHVESGLLAAYGGNRKFVLDDNSPGRLQFSGSDSSVHIDEQPEAGTLWHHLERNGISFRNFGEGFELAGLSEDKNLEPTGARFGTNVPMPDPLYRNTSRNYPGFNMNIPDQYRAGQFIAELESRYGNGKAPLPQFLFVHLPNDHIASPRAEDGYPYDVSYVADNDLALGRIVEYLSKSPWWPEMAVFVTEDDAQGGLDHVDFHRTVLMAAGPFIKRDYVSHRNSSFPGLLKTIFELLRMPPLNLMDVSAPDLADLFTKTPDYSPYRVVPVDARVFDPAKAKVGSGKSIEMDRGN